MSRQYNVRLGPLKMVATGCATALVLLLAAYVASVLFWGWLLTVFMGAFGPYHWSYLWTITHWALLAPFVLG